MQVASVTLDGSHVRLEPLEPHHADALLSVALDPRIWEFTTVMLRNADDVRTYIEAALAWQRVGAAVPFVTIDRATDQVIGSTRFENINAANRRTEIGWSWLNPKWWRTAINTEAKYLMLRHAFEEWKCIRVEFKAAANNRRSRNAILRLGAKEEGVLRRHLIQADGSYRDSVYFSILDDEWPEVKRRLEERLATGAHSQAPLKV
jgi:RimJ/RimL family protein N-acetyltransferase